ncbi:hypothetical protein IBG34_04780 [Aeromonas media]|uniref:DUF1311 domain-containing protein n=1 Tax=Aeromonas media TaxID=651 RepID=A0A6M4YEE6_AERME|nr:hypothetical protein [Aeromonas media]QJT21672.1 hypothetical protein E4184_09685 [Aeromonas media]QYK82237.1 hypothetical protein IBG34_04780 [Aeromonas media]
MKKIAILLITTLPLLAQAGFIHPMDFDGSEAQKQQVIQYIKERVKHDYCDGQLDMCQATTLRMMEQQNLDSFKKASQAKERAIMDRAIKDYCHGGIDMCSYDTIWMMYRENLKASNEDLSW